MTAKHPDLPYDYDALEPHIDEETMRLHHGTHHAGYVRKYNNAVSGTDLEGMGVDEVLADLSQAPDEIRTAVRNNGGGASNHAKFWNWMTPKNTNPEGELLEALQASFGGFEEFQKRFSDAAGSVFGSGWAWLVVDGGELDIVTTANQDSPISDGQTPILGLDVWEHSYYLKRQANRGAYIKAWWNVVNWDRVAADYEAAAA